MTSTTTSEDDLLVYQSYNPPASDSDTAGTSPLQALPTQGRPRKPGRLRLGPVQPQRDLLQLHAARSAETLLHQPPVPALLLQQLPRRLVLGRRVRRLHRGSREQGDIAAGTCRNHISFNAQCLVGFSAT
ncbi:hypothetical protein HPB48_018396 [Haemaphysalis longicornis]|uniref:Uncharacterized protein n=1 Tax=Haemaphysalis longicornis TaxID=44386 RepID=A0A9J6GEW9_HAELO|nr:hypothetical protein HPB48_018396 [Haemaphysalis longicornis]